MPDHLNKVLLLKVKDEIRLKNFWMQLVTKIIASSIFSALTAWYKSFKKKRAYKNK
jgi:hypothetical protein